MSKIDARKGMPARKFDRATFEVRFLSRFVDPRAPYGRLVL